MSHSCISKDVVTVFQNKTINEALLFMQLIIDYIGYLIYKIKDPTLDKDTELVPVMHARGTSGSAKWICCIGI